MAPRWIFSQSKEPPMPVLDRLQRIVIAKPTGSAG
jgi:hypothetical protein